MSAFLAKQPIFQDDLHVFGYELLYRGPRISAANGGAIATARVMCDALSDIGLDRIVTDKQVFINFDREMLEQGAASLLPPDRSVVEILEHVEATPDVIDLVDELRTSGVKVALDDFAFQDWAIPLLTHVDFIKIDVLAHDGDVANVAAKLQLLDVPLIAEKVETRAQYRRCRDLGYRYFQGYFFAKPETLSSNRIDSGQLVILQILAALQQEDGTPNGVARILARDVGLVHRLLKFANSAAIRRRRTLTSIADAIIVLGQSTMCRWASLILLAQLGGNKPKELLTLALTRARLCEQLSELDSSMATSAFTVGLLSVLDALLDRPMPVILRDLDLAPELAAALLGDRAAPLGTLLGLVLDYEQGRWSDLDKSEHIKMTSSLANSYVCALEFARSVSDAGSK
jgi:EAL and modified HD-GYP domain-containing signal transduction protein